MSTAPSTSSQRTLNADELAAWERDGFVVVRGLYSDAEMSACKALLKDLLVSEPGVKASGVRVWMCDAIHPTLLDAMRDQHVTPILKQIIGPDIEFLSAKAVFKSEETAFPSPWHQDWFYWGGATKVSIWIALDDATPENGCLMFVPGSHKKVFQKKEVEAVAFVNQIAPADLEGWPIYTAEVKRGDVVFFHDLAVHSSHPNSAKRDRWSIISTYRNGAVRDESTVWQASMIVTGRSVNTHMKRVE